MKKLLKNITLFILPLIVLLYPLDYFISKNLAKSGTDSKGETRVWKDIYEGKIASDVVVYGSSRAWMHFDTKILSDGLCTPTYNMGIDGHNFWLQYYRHTQYIKYNTRPGYILLSLDAFSMKKRAEGYNLSQFLPYSLFNKDMAAYTAHHKEFSQWDYYIPLLRYSGYYESVFTALKNVTLDSTPPLRYRGYQGKDTGWTEAPNNALPPPNEKVTIDPQMLQLLKRFVAECKHYKIKLVFIDTPQYYKSLKIDNNINSVMKTLKDYAKQQDILFLDYKNNPVCYKKEYFFNATHLNKKGAELFTQQLVTDLKKYAPDIAKCGN